MLDLGGQLATGAALLSPRGKVLENGYPRFFRRLAEGVFDIEDLKARTHELADFIDQAVENYHIDRSKLVAVGYSNGANIAASTLLLRPGVIPNAILFRSMLPLEPETPPQLTGTQVLMTGGRFDNMIPAALTERLATLLKEAGADVVLDWQQIDHRLTMHDVETAQKWIVEKTAVK